jgi:hypothetical protein
MAEKNVVWRNQTVMLNDNIYVGRISKAGMTLERKTTTLSSLGGIGDVAVPTGKLNASTATLEFSNLSTSDTAQLVGNDGWTRLRLTGECRVTDSATGTRVISRATTLINGWITNPPVNMFNNDEPYTANMSVLYMCVTDESGKILEVDWDNGTIFPDDNAQSEGYTITV